MGISDPDYDAKFHELLADMVADINARPPEERTEENNDLLHMYNRNLTPLVDRMLAAAHRLTRTECRALHRELDLLADKDVSTDADKAEMKRLRREVEDHPSILLQHIIPLRGLGPEWLEEHIQDTLWSWAWWADHFAMTDEEHMTMNRKCPAEHIEAVKASRPYPEGWLPETRRPGFYESRG